MCFVLIKNNFIDHQKGNWPIGVLRRAISCPAVPTITIVVWPSSSVTVKGRLLNPYFFCGCYRGWARYCKLGASSEEYLCSCATKLSSCQLWSSIQWGCSLVLCSSNIKGGLMIKLVSITTLINFNAFDFLGFRCHLIRFHKFNFQPGIWLKGGVVKSRISRS